MATRTKSPNAVRSGTTVGQGLLERVRHRARRRKNLAELRDLDCSRLRDIGLSEAARDRMVGHTAP